MVLLRTMGYLKCIGFCSPPINRRRMSLQSIWYDSVRRYTTRLVGIRSVSPGKGELLVAEEVLGLLRAGGLKSAYTESGLDPLVGDPFGRQNAYAFLRGRSPRTIVMLGHIDTVDTAYYGPLDPRRTA